jgi:hypothetical protein
MCCLDCSAATCNQPCPHCWRDIGTPAAPAGHLLPGESLACRFNFAAGGRPHLLQLELLCSARAAPEVGSPGSTARWQPSCAGDAGPSRRASPQQLLLEPTFGSMRRVGGGQPEQEQQEQEQQERQQEQEPLGSQQQLEAEEAEEEVIALHPAP